MQQKSEKYFKDYLKTIPNDQLIQFYDDVEWTAFPVLVIKEYQNRFKTKNKKEVIRKLKTHAEISKEKTKELRRSIAKNYGSNVSKNLKIKDKNLTKSISQTNFVSSEKNLSILEKLGELKKKISLRIRNFKKRKKNF